MISADGWLDWAIYAPGPSNKTNKDYLGFPLENQVRGVVLHSAEGYAASLLNVLENYDVSWHFSNLYGGQLYQHYPVPVQNWHCTSGNPYLVGVENEGIAGEILTDSQVLTARAIIAELAEYYGWSPKRPTSETDISHTLWEHNEVVRIGGSATACPSNRIPWDAILDGEGEEEEMIRHNAKSDYWDGLILNGDHPMSARGDFALPAEAKRVRLELFLESGYVDVEDAGGAHAGQVGWDGARYGTMDVDVELVFRGTCKFAIVGCVGYWK